ncbi:DUF3558 domain-containing protein [Nocardia sp. CA-290969]|uniref:DUF3558 domain-containing protein n=1 Tax=Nocardia sp. CA-290969 TaxID=3239986 RepID=UPI003D8F2F63
MNPWKLGVVVIAATGVLGSLVACSTTTEPSGTGAAESTQQESAQTSSSRTTLTESRLQPPEQQNEYTTRGRPEVVFDPCTWISDAAVEKAGLDPTTRRRGQDIVAEYTFLTCDFEGNLRDLSVNSGNVTWEEDLQKNGGHSEAMTVNGREALLVQDPALESVCSVHVRTEAGLVMFSSSRTHEGQEAGLQRCDGAVEIATALEPEIGAEN